MVGSAPPHRKQLAVCRQQSHLHVFHDGQRGKGFGNLKGAAHAESPDLARRFADQLMAVQQDRAAISAQLPVDHVEGGGLAGAVGPDQCQQLAGGQLKMNAIDRTHATERFAQAGHFEQAHDCASRTAALWRRLISCRAKPAIPCGNSSTSSKMMAPNMARQ